MPSIFRSLREHACLHQSRIYSFQLHSFLCNFRETNFLSSKWFSAVVSDGRRRVASSAAARGAATGACKKKSAGATDKERASETAHATASGGSQARDCADWEVSWRGECVIVNVWVTPTISGYECNCLPFTVARDSWMTALSHSNTLALDRNVSKTLSLKDTVLSLLKVKVKVAL
jgi:hypothetical protein